MDFVIQVYIFVMILVKVILMMSVYIEKSIADWRSYTAEQGVESSYSAIEVAGFPLNFYITIANPKLQGPLPAIGDYEIKKWR